MKEERYTQQDIFAYLVLTLEEAICIARNDLPIFPDKEMHDKLKDVLFERIRIIRIMADYMLSDTDLKCSYKRVENNAFRMFCNRIDEVLEKETGEKPDILEDW